MTAACLMLVALSCVAAHTDTFADLDGRPHRLFDVPKDSYRLLFFVSHDCPISNYYAPEIRRICADYSARGLRCALVYAGGGIAPDRARQHRSEYSHTDYPAFIDRGLARAAGATVTPEAVLYGPNATLLYRGRIDDTYAQWGKRRAQPSRRDLRRAIDESLAGKTVSVPRAPAIGCWLPSKQP